MEQVIQTHNLSRTYRLGKTEVHALRGVDLRIGQGEFVALMGSSGCGKSTLLHLLGCLDTPTGGSYLLEGREVSSLSKNERAHLRNVCIGFIFQNFNLLPRLSAIDNVALPLLYRAGEREALQRAEKSLARVGLSQRARHHPTEMSGGENQRVAMARALATDPLLLLADEPTGNLDSVTGAEIMALLEEISAEGSTILMVTHDTQVAGHAQRIIHMKDGRISL